MGWQPTLGIEHKVRPGPLAIALPDDEVALPGRIKMDERRHRKYLAPHLDGLGLWYLIPDVTILITLRSRNITTWGSSPLCDREMRCVSSHRWTNALHAFACTSARSCAIEAAVRAWKLGCPQPLTRHVLSTSKAISDTYVEQVVDLAKHCKGDGATLLHALRSRAISGFRQRSVEEREEFLQNNGCMSAVEQLPPALMRAEAISAVAGELGQGVLTEAEIDTLLRSIGGQTSNEVQLEEVSTSVVASLS